MNPDMSAVTKDGKNVADFAYDVLDMDVVKAFVRYQVSYHIHIIFFYNY